MSLLLFAFAAAAAQPAPPQPDYRPRAAATPPPIITISPSLTKLSSESRVKAQALSRSIEAEQASKAKSSMAETAAAQRAFDAALGKSPPDFPAILEAARNYDAARALGGKYNEQWVTLAQSLPPADQAALLDALPAPRGRLLVPSTIMTPEPKAPKSSEQLAKEAALASAHEKINAAIKADEADRKLRFAKVEAARRALTTQLDGKTLAVRDIETAMNRVIDAQAETSRAQGVMLARAISSLTPAERDAITSGALGRFALIAITGR